ncbi:MAG: hypothetical protein R3245_00535, partial [Kiloniellales bacterium]|nr:hypothetical protein [Kiloniellales bacterium]
MTRSFINLMYCRTSLFAAVLGGVALFAPQMSRAAPPDFSICDGLSGAAWGLCRAGVAVGCADEPPTGNPEACMSIEDNYAAVTGEDPPWIAPPLPHCPCDYSTVPQTEAEWTTGIFGTFVEIFFSCPAGVLPGANFSSWDGEEFVVGAQITTNFDPNICAFSTSDRSVVVF